MRSEAVASLRNWMKDRLGEQEEQLRAVERAVARLGELDEERASGAAWERAIGRACGRVLFHASRGDAVGLRVDERLIPPSTGNAHRRKLLATLAGLPS